MSGPAPSAGRRLLARSWRLAVAVALLAALLPLTGPSGPSVAAASTTAPNPLTCTGYPQPRVFMEAIDWWQPTLSGSEDFGHVHGGACFPRTHHPDGSVNKMAGKVRLDVRVMLHNNPGELRFVRVHLTDPNANHQVARVSVNERCVKGGARWSTQHNACVWWVPVEFDTSVANFDGFQEVRVGASVKQHDTDDSMFSSTGWQLYLNNGKPVKHYRSNSDGSPREHIEGRGWYEGAKYTNARLEERLPYEVKGVWEPRVRLLSGAGGIGVKRSFASINANFHHGDPGTVLLDRSGPFTGRLRIDTTKLPDGVHRLFLRADAPCNGTAGNDCGRRANGDSLNVSTNSGVLAVSFVTKNGNSPEPAPTHSSTPTPEPSPTSPSTDSPSMDVLHPTDDAHVKSSRISGNYGGDTELQIRGGNTVIRSLLQFQVPTPGHAKLRMYVTTGSSEGGTIHRTATGWRQQTVTWASAPTTSGQPLNAAGRVEAGRWAEWDLGIVTAGTHSFALSSSSSTSAFYSSAEGSNPPQLMVHNDETGGHH